MAFRLITEGEFQRYMEELKQVFPKFRDKLWVVIIDDVIRKTMMSKYFMESKPLSLYFR